MPTFRRFDEIEVWQKARELTKVVYNFPVAALSRRILGLREQIRRASV
jgi:hypothetical protein